MEFNSTENICLVNALDIFFLDISDYVGYDRAGVLAMFKAAAVPRVIFIVGLHNTAHAFSETFTGWTKRKPVSNERVAIFISKLAGALCASPYNSGLAPYNSGLARVVLNPYYTRGNQLFYGELAVLINFENEVLEIFSTPPGTILTMSFNDRVRRHEVDTKCGRESYASLVKLHFPLAGRFPLRS